MKSKLLRLLALFLTIGVVAAACGATATTHLLHRLLRPQRSRLSQTGAFWTPSRLVAPLSLIHI